MLKIENVTKYYGDIPAVKNLSFEVKDGETSTKYIDDAKLRNTLKAIIGYFLY